MQQLSVIVLIIWNVL